MKKLIRRIALLLPVWSALQPVLHHLHTAQAQVYYFTTIAGQPGVPGHTDGTNHEALFYRPSDLVLDDNGALYVSDTFNCTIRKLTPARNDWVVTTVAGLAGTVGSQDGTNGGARFNSPNGIARDGAGNLFVADHNNHTIRKLAPEGTNWVVTTIAGLAGTYGTDDGTNNTARFRIPMGIAVDSDERLFVVDTANFTIRMLHSEGTNWVVSTIAGTPYNYDFVDGLNGTAAFNFPYGLALGPDGALYVNDAGNYAIRRITELAGGWETVTIANARGIMGSQDGPARHATFNTVNGIALDSQRNIYVADQSNHTIRKLTWSGRDWDVSTIGGVPGVHGTADGIGSNALFWMPWGVAVSGAGAIYVADAYNHTIRRGVPVATLEIARQGTQVVLSWPQEPSGFLLERSYSLAATDAWEPVTNGIATAGGRFRVTNSIIGAGAFYRLRR